MVIGLLEQDIQIIGLCVCVCFYRLHAFYRYHTLCVLNSMLPLKGYMER